MTPNNLEVAIQDMVERQEADERAARIGELLANQRLTVARLDRLRSNPRKDWSRRMKLRGSYAAKFVRLERKYKAAVNVLRALENYVPPTPEQEKADRLGPADPVVGRVVDGRVVAP